MLVHCRHGVCRNRGVVCGPFHFPEPGWADRPTARDWRGSYSVHRHSPTDWRSAPDRAQRAAPLLRGVPLPSFALLLCAVAALALLAASVHAAHGRPLAWDVLTHAAALHHREDELTAAAIVVTDSAETVAYVLAGLGGALLWQRRAWLGALLGVSVLMLGQVGRLDVSVALARPRPPAADWAWSASGFAFPSGHTTTATLAGGLLAVGLIRRTSGIRRRVGIGLCGGWALAVGCTRIYLGMHWLTDVLGGWLLGGVLTLLVAIVGGLVRSGLAGVGRGGRQLPEPLAAGGGAQRRAAHDNGQGDRGDR
jgi:undecaprenyl-diphosphatase